MPPVLAAIPYQTFPMIGPLRTFGLMVGLAVVVGSWIAATHAERFGIERDEIYRLSTRMVVAGVIGSRITWDITHWDEIERPLDLIAVWEGGLQFSGGFIAAVLVGMPTFLSWNRLTRWRVLDGAAMALAAGVVIGRIGCVAVGEHFGGVTDFPLAVKWTGGEPPDVREATLGLEAGAPLVREGLVFHNTALYELVAVLILFVLLQYLYRRRNVSTGTIGGLFLLYYAPSRFFFDSLRVNDERVAGLTGAQWMTLAIVPIALWILFKVRPAVQKMEEAEAAEAVAVTDESSDGVEVADRAAEPDGSSHRTADVADRDEALTPPPPVEGADATNVAGGRRPGNAPPAP